MSRGYLAGKKCGVVTAVDRNCGPARVRRHSHKEAHGPERLLELTLVIHRPPTRSSVWPSSPRRRRRSCSARACCCSPSATRREPKLRDHHEGRQGSRAQAPLRLRRLTAATVSGPHTVRKKFTNRCQLPTTTNDVSAGQSHIPQISNVGHSWGDTSLTTTEWNHREFCLLPISSSLTGAGRVVIGS